MQLYLSVTQLQEDSKYFPHQYQTYSGLFYMIFLRNYSHKEKGPISHIFDPSYPLPLPPSPPLLQVPIKSHVASSQCAPSFQFQADMKSLSY